MRRLVLSCLAALFAVMGLSTASEGASSEAQALLPARVSAAPAVPGPVGPAAGSHGVASAGEAEREPVFLGMVALAAVAAGLSAGARLHTAARRRTG
jgi:hypothetical protein